MDEGLSIGELARRAGVTVRALRLYGAAGLLKPLRAQASAMGRGRRVYGAGEVARLGQVMALKRAGYTLKRIHELIGGQRVGGHLGQGRAHVPGNGQLALA